MGDLPERGGCRAIAFHVPWDVLCSDNRKFLTGKFILTSAYRNGKHEIAKLSASAARGCQWERTERIVGLSVIVREPDRRKRDLNWSKNLKDGITEGNAIWDDDSQVRIEHWELERASDKAEAGASVCVWQLSPSLAATNAD